MCGPDTGPEVLGVSPSGYYAWLHRRPSERDREDATLTERIRTIHEQSSGTYGAPRVHAELRARGVRVGRKRVARLMRQSGLSGVSRRRGPRTTVRKRDRDPSPDLVGRDFSATAPNRLWVADITYVPTGSGFLFLAVALDAFSRRVVGWAMAGHLRTGLVLAALDMAVAQRKPKSVIHHSDQGSQYTSLAFGQRCREAGVRPRRARPAIATTTQCARASLRRYECELIERRRFATKAEARMAVFAFIEGWYNPRRRHSALSYASPMEYEREHQANTEHSTPKPSDKPG